MKNEIIKNERINNERIKNELIKKRTDPPWLPCIHYCLYPWLPVSMIALYPWLPVFMIACIHDCPVSRIALYPWLPITHDCQWPWCRRKVCEFWPAACMAVWGSFSWASRFELGPGPVHPHQPAASWIAGLSGRGGGGRGRGTETLGVSIVQPSTPLF